MKKIEFRKPFSTFNTEPDYYLKTTIKERWIHALHDPGYLFLMLCVIVLFSILFINI
jgi:hypothetical protein